MTSFIIRRAGQAIVVLILVTLIVFSLMRLLPGDPVLLYLSQDSYSRMTSQEEIDAVRHKFGTDRPLMVQYVDWIANVLRGDLGKSIFMGTTVTEEVGRALPKTLYIGILAWIVSHLFGIPAGIICAVRRGKWQDTLLTFIANIGITAPIFWLSILLIYLFGLQLEWLPIQGFTSPFDDFGKSVSQLILPVFCMSFGHMAGSTRQTRSAMLEVIGQDFIRTAWSKGLSERAVIVKHAIRNGIIPVVTLSAMTIPGLFGGSVFIENVFNIPGMGRLATQALFSKDYAITQGVVLIIATIIVTTNFLVDVSYGLIDPRIRHR